MLGNKGKASLGHFNNEYSYDAFNNTSIKINTSVYLFYIYFKLVGVVNTQFLYKDLSKIPGMSPQEIVHVWKKKQLNKEEPV